MNKKKKTILKVIIAFFAAIFLAVAVLWIVNPWIVNETLIYVAYKIGGNNKSIGIDATKVDVDGIDVSHHNGWIEWDKVAANKKIRFVYVKATQGAGYKDDMFRRNMREAKKAGFEVGAYHFFTGNASGKSQFRNFKKTVGHKYIGTIIPMVDVEYSGVKGMKAAKLRKELKTFCDLVAKEYGRKPVIYTNPGIYNNWLGTAFDSHYIWICRYGRKPNLKRTNHNIWQFSEHGKVDGIGGHTDLNSFAKGMTLQKLKF